jgi:hypothetical protein
VCKIKKALYRLKQILRAWYIRIGRYLQSMGFTKSEVYSNLYFILVGSDLVILVLYVDVLFLTSAKEIITGCKADLDTKLNMKDINLMHYFSGLEFWQRLGEIFLGHRKYTMEILRRFMMDECRLMATPMVTNPKKILNSDSYLADPRMYK